MGSSQKVVAGTFAVMVLLVGLAFATELSNHYQVLPFSSWSLFSRQPARVRVDYGLRFTSIDGEPRDPAVYFESAGLASSASPPAFELIQDVGGHVDREEPLRAQTTWGTFAGRFLADVATAEVEVVRREYDILDRRRCDCFETETVVGLLRKGP